MNEHPIVLAAAAITDTAARAAYLDSTCGGDAGLRARVEAHLKALEGPENSPDPAALAAEAETSDWVSSPRPRVPGDAVVEDLECDFGAPAAGVTRGPDAVPAAPATADHHAPRPLTEGPGTRIGPYKLLQKVGEGGMGVVYMAEQETPVRRRVALKIIKPGMDTEQVVSRFEVERQALAIMDHPGIAKVFDAGATDSGRPYFVMELVHGVPITEYCDRNRLSPRERLELFVPVCQAIQHAHQKGIIHRDIKPSNVLVALHDGTPVPKVIDFGVAKATSQRLTERTIFTQLGVMVGTLEYMSPEQAEMTGLDIDTRSDIYSLGVMLYELLTGTTPLERARLREAGYAEIVRMIREEEPPKPSTRLSDSGEALPSIAASRKLEPARLTRLVRGELDWIAMKALEKDRTRRYGTATGLARDIERYLADEPVEACPPSTTYRLRKFAWKNRVLLAAAALVATTLVLGTGVSLWQAVVATQARREAVRSEMVARQDRDRAVRAERAALQSEATALRDRNRAVKAELQARTEASIASAVNDFLQNDLLAEADPVNNPRGQQVTVEALLGKAAKEIAGKFIGQPLVEAAIRQTVGQTYGSLGLYRESQPHLERALELRRRLLGPEHPNTLTTLLSLGDLYHVQGRYDEAELLLKQTLETRRRVLGAEHPSTLTSMASLGDLYHARGRYDEAEPLKKQALETRRRVLGLEHPSTLAAMHNLATLYQGQGRYSEAEPLFLQVLETSRRVLGPEHPSTLTSMASLGILYRFQGHFSEAEPLLKQALESSQRVLGPEHHGTLRAMGNLAVSYVEQGRYAQAEPLLKQTMEVSRRVLGAEHPSTLVKMESLGLLYRKEGRFDDAERLLAGILEARRRVIGPEHPRTLSGMGILVSIYQAQGRYSEAEPLIKQVLEVQRRVLGPEHLDTLTTMGNLGFLYQEWGFYSKAEPLYQQVLEARRRLFGPEHPSTLTSMVEMGIVYHALGRDSEAKPLLQQALDARRRILGPEHPGTLNAMANLGEVYRALGQHGEAEPLSKQALEASRRVLGPEHPETLAATFGLGLLCHSQGRHDEAESLFRQVLEAQRRVLGPEHPSTLKSMAALASFYHDRGRYSEAESLYTQVLEARGRVLGPEHPSTLKSMAALASFYHDRGRYSEAEPLLVGALRTHRKILGPEHLTTRTAAKALDSLRKDVRAVTAAEAAFRNTLKRRGAEHGETVAAHRSWGTALLAAGAYGPAGTELQAALEDARRLQGPDARATLVTRRCLAWLHFKQNPYGQAETEYRSLLDDDRRVLGEKDKETANVLVDTLSLSLTAKKPELALELCRPCTGPLDPRASNALAVQGLSLLQRKECAGAETLLRLCLLTREESQPDHWSTFDARSLLGGSLLGQGRHAEAEPLLLSGYEGMKARQVKIPAASKSKLPVAAERIVQLYEALGQPVKAAEWRAIEEIDSGRAVLPDDVFARP